MNIELQMGDKVRFSGKSEHFPLHTSMAEEYLQRGKLYTVSHYFHGVPAQIELQEVTDVLFSVELFEHIV